MMNSEWILILFIVLPSISLITGNGKVYAADEVEEDEIDDDGNVEEEGGSTEEEVDDIMRKNVSPDVETRLLFTKPTVSGPNVELPAGKLVQFLIGFSNKGESKVVIDSLDASFRYPLDFSFHIQNFSGVAYDKKVESKEESTIAYSFIPADAFAGRPIGLTINLAYHDLEGNSYLDPVFNETVQIVEFDEGFDSEVFFMYLFLVAIALLVVFLVINFVGPKSSKKKSPAARPVETGTANDDVDYEWIPKSALRTPGSSKTTPRQRKRGAASANSDTE